MFVSLGKKQEHGFDRPIDLLSDCHRRIEHFLGVLVRVVEQSQRGELSAESRQAMEAALRYFETAAPRHTADEEESLFPRLRDSGDERAREAMSKLQALEADHRVADKAQEEMEFWCKRWLKEGPLAPDQVRRLEKVVKSLQELYQRHIAVEDSEVFPLARTVLGQEQIEQVGREMAGRRGLSR